MANASLNFPMHIVPAHGADIQTDMSITVQTEFGVGKTEIHRLAAFDQLTTLVREHSGRIANITRKPREGMDKGGGAVAVHNFDFGSGRCRAAEDSHVHLDGLSLVVSVVSKEWPC